MRIVDHGPACSADHARRIGSGRPWWPASSSFARLLPHGPFDVVRQIVLFFAAYYGYSLVRGLRRRPAASPRPRSRTRAGSSRSSRRSGIFVEPSVQAWATGSGFLIDGASWVYLNAQTTVTVGALVWIYLLRNQCFYFVRNMMLIAMGIALVGYILYPTAPPRFFPEWGFFDTVSDFTGVEPDSDGVNALFNPYAAVPSMHVASR